MFAKAVKKENQNEEVENQENQNKEVENEEFENKENQNDEVEKEVNQNEEVEMSLSGNQTQEVDKEKKEEKQENGSKKRSRQPTLFEMSGLFEKRMEELLSKTDKVEEAKTHEKLEQLLKILKELKKMKVEMNQMKQHKKQKLENIDEIKNVLQKSLKVFEFQDEKIEEMEVEIVKLKNKEKRAVPEELLLAVKVELRNMVKDILENFEEIELNDSRTNSSALLVKPTGRKPI